MAIRRQGRGLFARDTTSAHPVPAWLPSLGVNLTGITTYSLDFPFINAFNMNGTRGAAHNSQWVTQKSGTFDTGEEAYVQVDANGWPTSLTASPIPSGGQQFTSLQVLLFFDCTVPPGAAYAFYPGTYAIQFQGAGTMTLGNDASSLSTSSTGVSVSGDTITSTMTSTETGVVTFSVLTPSSGGVAVTVTATDPSSTGNYLRNMYLGLQSNLASWNAGGIFTSDYINFIKQFDTIRSMGWSSVNDEVNSISLAAAPANGATSATLASAWTNSSGSYRFTFDTTDVRVCTCTVGSTAISWTGGLSKAGSTTTAYWNFHAATWAARPMLSNSIYGGPRGAPFELVIALANQTSTNPWFNLPIDMPDADVTSLAALIQSTLNSGLKAYIELSNEVWNSEFTQEAYASWVGQNMWPDYAARGYSAYDCTLNYYGMRVAKVADLFSAQFGSSFSSTVRILCGGQCAATYPAQSALDAPLWLAETTGNTAPYLHGIYGVCIAPYFGGYDAPAAWAYETQSSALTSLFDQINSGGVIYGDSQTGESWMSQCTAGISAHATMLGGSPYAAEGISLVGYEGGQSLVAETTMLTGVNNGPSAWVANHSYGGGWTAYDPSGHVHKTWAGGTSGATAPTWNTTLGGTTTDGTITWFKINNKYAPWAANAAFAVGEAIYESSNVQVCTTAGTTGATIPTFSTSGTTADGTVTWTFGCANTAVGGGSPNYTDTYHDSFFWPLFDAANRDTRMGTATISLLNAWKSAGGKLINYFIGIQYSSKYGAWGAAESMMQIVNGTTPAKLQALYSFMAANNKWWT